MDRPLTFNQRAYLHSFDGFLRARSGVERSAHRKMMVAWFDQMLEDAALERGRCGPRFGRSAYTPRHGSDCR